MKLKLNIIVSDADNNIMTTLQHTGVHYPTHTIVHEVEVEIPDLPRCFAVDSISLRADDPSLDIDSDTVVDADAF